MKGLHYLQNINTSAGLFIGRKRIAWWPASIPIPNQIEAEMVRTAYEAKGEPLGREEVQAIMQKSEGEV